MVTDSTIQRLWKSRWLCSKFEDSARNSLAQCVRDVIRAHGIRIYGSFLYGTFHLDTNISCSFSDVDCLSESRCNSNVSGILEYEIARRSGHKLKVSVRPNLNHVKALPKRISDGVAYVEAALHLLKKGDVIDEYYTYLLCKYVLRTAFYNLAIHDFVRCGPHHSEWTNAVCFLLIRTKLFGGQLSSIEWANILDYLKKTQPESYRGLNELMTSCTTNTLVARWERYREEISTAGMIELREDLDQKVSCGIGLNVNGRYFSNTMY